MLKDKIFGRVATRLLLVLSFIIIGSCVLDVVRAKPADGHWSARTYKVVQSK
jgi:hypothetical protein